MMLTERQFNFCQDRLRMIGSSIPKHLRVTTEKAHMDFSVWGCLIVCELAIGDFVIDSFFPEVYA